MTKSNKVDEAWDKIFSKYEIDKHLELDGTYNISANDIKEFREPRLMTKFDWSDSRPQLFKEKNLSILPDSRGTYVIGKFKAYQNLGYQEIKPISVKKPDWIRSFDEFPVTSESVALNLAQMTGMIDNVMGTVLEEPNAVGTITGRLKSGKLDYNIDLENSKNSYNFKVDNSQVEIDAGFENLNNLAIIEAKNRIPKDFMIRQLYYPFVGYNNLGTGKVVMPIYFTHADDVYGFHIFEFPEKNNYSSIKKIKQINFIIDEDLNITIESVKKISMDSRNEMEPTTVPYPQADNFTKVLDMLQHLLIPKNKQELADDYNFNDRQSDYYGNALIYLNFAIKKDGKFELTDLGKRVVGMPNNNTRNKIIIEQILNHKTFNIIFENTLRNGGEYHNNFIAQTLYNNVPRINSIVTAERRTSTVKSWLDWILNTATAE